MTSDPGRGNADNAGEEVRTHSYSLSLSGSPDSPSPAAAALDEAIDASIEGRQLFPDGAAFINGDAPHIGRAIAVAVEEHRPVVLCFADGRRHVLQPDPPASI
jgi:hypothetical protein